MMFFKYAQIKIWQKIKLCILCILFPVRERIGPIATPDFIQNAPALPKTRSGKHFFKTNIHPLLSSSVASVYLNSGFPLGKIMRRILRQIARNDKDLGDLSTLADPKVVEELFSQRCEAPA